VHRKTPNWVKIALSYLKKMNENHKNEKGLALGLSIIAILIILGISPFFYGFKLGPVKPGPSSILTGIYLQFWGILFLLSYYYSHKTFFFRGLIWICENFSSPRGRKMAFFYFLLAFFLGTMALIQGLGLFSTGNETKGTMVLPAGTEPIENWWYKDPLLYIVLIIMVAGIYYRYKKRNKK